MYYLCLKLNKSLQAFFIKPFLKKLTLDSFYCFSPDIRLKDWWKLICIDQLRSFLSYPREISNIFNITSKCLFFIFNNTLPWKLSRAYNRRFSYMLFLFILKFHDLNLLLKVILFSFPKNKKKYWNENEDLYFVEILEKRKS